MTHVNAAAEKRVRLRRGELVGSDFRRVPRRRAAGDELAGLVARARRATPTGARRLWIPGGLDARARRRRRRSPPRRRCRASTAAARTFHTLILRDVNDRLEAERRIQLADRRDRVPARGAARRSRGDGHPRATASRCAACCATSSRSPRPTPTVLILGETGTGKELVARAIHAAQPRAATSRSSRSTAPRSRRRSSRASSSATSGARSPARRQRRDGRFELADGGTLFLDEVGELPLDLQVKLLRVLQEGEFEPVGSRSTRKVDVRVIAATNRDLAREVADGRFREDLYYRLNVFPIQLPPLRERGDDVSLLAAGVRRSATAQRMGRQVEPLSGARQRAACAATLAGNVRELQNVIERAVITAPTAARPRARRCRAAPEPTRSLRRPPQRPRGRHPHRARAGGDSSARTFSPRSKPRGDACPARRAPPTGSG